jgi:signal transduction histidine kinase
MPLHVGLSTGTVDQLGILSASRALSSETSIEKLHGRVVEVLGTMTGATKVQLVWRDEPQGWLLPGSERGPGRSHDEHALPMTVLRYMQRSGELVVVADVTSDERFACDPYFADLPLCALLAVPVVTRGAVAAALVLEDTLTKGAFSVERIDAVKLVADQLAVSLDNAQLYADFRKVADEQAALRRVATLVARDAPPAELFAAVAEEVGRILPVVDVAYVGRYGGDRMVEFVGAWGRERKSALLGEHVGLGGDNVASRVFASNTPARVDRLADDSLATALARKEGVRSGAGAPINVAGTLWGVITVASSREEGLPAGVEARLADFTELLATAIANAEAREKLSRVADEQAALRRVATLVAQGALPPEVFAAVTDEVGHLLGTEVTWLRRYLPGPAAALVAAFAAGERLPSEEPRALGGQNLATLVYEAGRPARVHGSDWLLHDSKGVPVPITSGIGVPVVVEGSLWGAMSVASSSDAPLPLGTEERLAAFTELVATAIANAEAHDQLSASRARVVASADETRRRIERDLHDGAQQRLLSLTLQLQAIGASVPPEEVTLAEGLDRVSAGFLQALDELRELARGIHPAILAETGLGPALRALARRSAVPVELDLRVEDRFPERVEVTVYYVVSEALTNAAKHASATVVHVDLDARDDLVRLTIRDDGVGGADPLRGSGLLGMRDRVEATGGRIAIHSPVSEGTELLVELPLRPPWAPD